MAFLSSHIHFGIYRCCYVTVEKLPLTVWRQQAIGHNSNYMFHPLFSERILDANRKNRHIYISRKNYSSCCHCFVSVIMNYFSMCINYSFKQGNSFLNAYFLSPFFVLIFIFFSGFIFKFKWMIFLCLNARFLFLCLS